MTYAIHKSLRNAILKGIMRVEKPFKSKLYILFSSNKQRDICLSAFRRVVHNSSEFYQHEIEKRKSRSCFGLSSFAVLLKWPQTV